MMFGPRIALAVFLTIVIVSPAPASSPPALQPGAADATATCPRSYTLHSRVLDEDRTLLIRLPRGYEDGDERYPVLWVLDAEWHFDLAAADVGLLAECSYAQPHPVPPLIVVGVVNVDRNRDFTPTHCPEALGMHFPTSGGAERFRRFLREEALPAVDAGFRTQPFRVLAGWSLGGLFTVETCLEDTGLFDANLAISPSLWWDDQRTLQRLAGGAWPASAHEAGQLVVTLGSVEKERESKVARSTAAFLEHLAARPLAGLTVEEVPVPELGHNYSPKMAFFLGLATIFADLSLPAEVLDEGLAGIDAYYEALTARYGFEVPVPEDAFSTLGWRCFEAGDSGQAGEIFTTWTARHPDSALAHASLGAFRRATGDAEQALVSFRRAIVLEEASAAPRQGFILDLRREVAALEQGD